MSSTTLEPPRTYRYKLTADFDTTLVNTFGEWKIRPDVLYLDNGAFGACPIPVCEKHSEIRQRIEENPHEFFERSYTSSWLASRDALAKFLNADPSGLVLTPGATYGLNAVIQSLSFNRNDEILTTDHAYSSVRLVLEHVARRDGAKLVIVNIPIANATSNGVFNAIVDRVTPRTRFAVIDHIPSRSGLIFPIEQIVSELASRNIDTLVDGAHAPGMIPVDIKSINAAYYVANCHKWMCSPRGVGFLHVRKDRAHNIKPLVIARSPHVIERAKHSNLEHEFTWLGTNDPSGPLTLPTAIEFLNSVVPGGYEALTGRNHNLAVLARKIICKAIGVPIPCPDDMIGTMATIPLPDSPEPEGEGMLRIQQTLWKEHRIVIPVYSWPSYPKRVIRLSVQAYNSLEQYLRLAHCLRSALCHEQSPVPRMVGSGHTRACSEIHPQDSSNETQWIEFAGACGHEDSWGSDAAPSLNARHHDIDHPTQCVLMRLAETRIRRIAAQVFASYPVALYPTPGEAETCFTAANGPASRHANMEMSRMTYMLSQVNERKIPQLTLPTIVQLLETNDVIESWPETARILRNQAKALPRAIISNMGASRTPEELPTIARDFTSLVVPYKTEATDQNVSHGFWLRALSDFTKAGNRNWSLPQIEAFLQIHAFLKDPVGGLRRNFKTQSELFLSMLNELRSELENMKLADGIWEGIVAQLALESSFMANALVQDASYVHFCRDQQMVYSYVDIDSLGRSEFASPAIVIEMIQNFLDSEKTEHSIAPIAIAYGYAVCSSSEIHGVPDPDDREPLRQYCQNYGLGPVWFLDICAVVQKLNTSHKEVLGQLRNLEKLAPFRDIRQVPTLVTEEASFLTRLIGEKGETILQPVQQCIFASDDVLVALPAKAQRHGRSKGFKALPIR
ncbi:pyridoxal phosphate-dependent transferase [Thelonectria olida]|uniref:Pyridoxal phosphate-dependent transferase n=1 Tax=Thelonectria olida TaxID=1576542 RepID=A0A9P8W4E2_9HYPO|nr:pyridoxal phosphate-dependent transferase [Thelonectria olida]